MVWGRYDRVVGGRYVGEAGGAAVLDLYKLGGVVEWWMSVRKELVTTNVKGKENIIIKSQNYNEQFYIFNEISSFLLCRQFLVVRMTQQLEVVQLLFLLQLQPPW